MRRAHDAHEALAWLEERAPGSGQTGYDVEGWEAAAWILHAMYETDELPEGLTHDDERKLDLAAGAAEDPPIIAGILEGATMTGVPLGWAAEPGPGWRRLRWAELGDRLGIEPLARSAYPCHDSFPYRSWPVNVQPPCEGSLDVEQFLRLVPHLTDAGADGADTTCRWYYSPVATSRWDEPPDVFEGRLWELEELPAQEAWDMSPTNIWPLDRRWLVWTDWDLWATKVRGSRRLVEALRQDPDLETADLGA